VCPRTQTRERQPSQKASCITPSGCAILGVIRKDNVVPRRDSIELEREKGVTIQSAAMFRDCNAKSPITSHTISLTCLICHVDFMIEVEPVLCVLEVSFWVICAVSAAGIQIRWDDFPWISFNNEMDRQPFISSTVL